METIRALLKRLAPQPAKPSPSPRPSHETTDGRESRATHVSTLQADVRRIQQEIADHSHSSREVGAAAFDAKMSTLERELETAQRELSKLQGRV